MSLDIWLEGVGDDAAATPVECFWANYTHNVTPMWDRAGCYEALYHSDGKAAAEILPALRSALQSMRSDPDTYKALDAPNGWGSCKTALPWLERLVEACEAHPRATVRVSR